MLSEEVWRIKDAGGTPEVTWRILQRSKAYTPQSRRCTLCLTEKLAIAEHEGRDILNKRSEIVAKCRHQFKYQLSNKVTEEWRQTHGLRQIGNSHDTITRSNRYIDMYLNSAQFRLMIVCSRISLCAWNSEYRAKPLVIYWQYCAPPHRE